mmetsp:Transcript_37957/g.109181  ORF Transcript_37957/g.109181 Transcript_37957/m.109181 type:complete len:338 (-) Transcript_37957:447-1460(-)
MDRPAGRPIRAGLRRGRRGSAVARRRRARRYRALALRLERRRHRQRRRHSRLAARRDPGDAEVASGREPDVGEGVGGAGARASGGEVARQPRGFAEVRGGGRSRAPSETREDTRRAGLRRVLHLRHLAGDDPVGGARDGDQRRCEDMHLRGRPRRHGEISQDLRHQHRADRRLHRQHRREPLRGGRELRHHLGVPPRGEPRGALLGGDHGPCAIAHGVRGRGAADLRGLRRRPRGHPRGPHAVDHRSGRFRRRPCEAVALRRRQGCGVHVLRGGRVLHGLVLGPGGHRHQRGSEPQGGSDLPSTWLRQGRRIQTIAGFLRCGHHRRDLRLSPGREVH